MQYLEEFTSYLTQKKLSKATIKNYSKDVLRFIAWNEEKGETPFYPQAVQQEHITHYIYSLKVSSASKQRHLSSLRKFFAFLKSEGIIGKTPGSLPIWVKPKEPQELSSGQRSSDTTTSQPFSPYSTESHYHTIYSPTSPPIPHHPRSTQPHHSPRLPSSPPAPPPSRPTIAALPLQNCPCFRLDKADHLEYS